MAFIVHDVGSKLLVAPAVEAVVRQVRICEGHSVSYLVSWWHEGSLKEEWVFASEVASAEGAYKRLRVSPEGC